MLYGFLLDRACLSRQNGEKWLTPEGHPFVIFTIEEIRLRLNCGKNKAIRQLEILEELDLIKRSRPKKDGPYHIVVKPFDRGVSNRNLPGFQNETCPDPESKPGQVLKGNLNKTDINNTDINNTDMNKTEITTLLEERIKSRIQYDYLIGECPRNQVDTIVDVMVQTLMSPAKTITVAGVPMDGETVRKYLEQAEFMRIHYIFDHMDTMDQPIRSYRSYFLARLCDPEGAVDAFYDQQHRLNDW